MSTNHYKFPTLERDAESGLDHATFRQLSSAQGRWLSPDPYYGSYDLGNPQSFNRYAYVLNNPLGRVDPLGLDSETSTVVYDDDGNILQILDNTSVDVNGGGGSDLIFIGGGFGSGTGGISDSGGGDAPYINPTMNFAPNNGISSTPPPNTPKTRDQCSIYNDGTASGTALYNLCSKFFPNGNWSNKMRGCLQSKYVPGSGYLPIPFPVTIPNGDAGLDPAGPTTVIDLNDLIPGSGAHVSCAWNPTQ